MRFKSTLVSFLLAAASVLGLSSCASARLKRAVKQERGLKKVSLDYVVHTRSCRGGRARFEGERRDASSGSPERLCGEVCCDHGECRFREFARCGRAPPR